MSARQSLQAHDIPAELAPAYRECVALAKSHYENFTVAAWFLPKRLLPHVAAVYAYCRGVDDLGDEAAGDRLALLDAWEADLDQCYGGTPSAPRLRAASTARQVTPASSSSKATAPSARPATRAPSSRMRCTRP